MTRRKRTRLWEVIKDEGRTYVWLSAKTGYSADHIGAVARGQRHGTEAFYIAMRIALGGRPVHG